MPNHEVEQGECCTTIAADHNLASGQKVYDHPNNQALREKRPDPNVLAPGDVVFVPSPAERAHPAATSAQHVFQAAEPKKKLILLLEDADDHALADMKYTLVVKGEKGEALATIDDKTDDKGKIETGVAPDARDAELTVGNFKWKLRIGDLNPIANMRDQGQSGAIQRLRNLGYKVPAVPTSNQPLSAKQRDEADLRRALASFQARRKLTVSGELDEETGCALEAYHLTGSGLGPSKDKPGTTKFDEAKRLWAEYWEWEPGKQRETDVAPSTEEKKTPNVLGAPCTCFVCTLKMVVAKQSNVEMKYNADNGVGAAPPSPTAMLGWFRDDPITMNIVGLRRRHSFTNLFDDKIISFFRADVAKDEKGDDWQPIQQKYALKSMDAVIGTSRFVPCKRVAGGYWVSLYTASTDPGAPPPKKGVGPIKMSALDGGEHDAVKATLASGRAFVCPSWYKQTWHVGVHKTHLALAEIENVLCERLFPATDLKKVPDTQAWLRVYSGGKEPVDHAEHDVYLEGTVPKGVKGDYVEVEEGDVLGRRYMFNGAFNIHRGHNHPESDSPFKGEPVNVNDFSEGCQVFPKVAEFDQFLTQCQLTKWRFCKKGNLDASCTWAKDKAPHGKRDHLSSCDLARSCSVKFDYVLVELPGADLDKVVTEFGALSQRPEGSPTFKNGNKLFVGGPKPAGASGDAAAPGPAKPAPAKPGAQPPAKPAPHAPAK